MNIPSAQEQLKFLKNLQLILQSGSFSSTYKFALLISLSRLAIERGQDSGESLALEYTDIAEKFIELYWKQAVPYTFNDQGQLILNQNNGKQAALYANLAVIKWVSMRLVYPVLLLSCIIKPLTKMVVVAEHCNLRQYPAQFHGYLCLLS